MVANPLSALISSLVRAAMGIVLVPLFLIYSYILGSISLFSAGDEEKRPSIFLIAAKLVLGGACVIFGLGLALNFNYAEPVPFIFIYSAAFSIAFGGAIYLFFRPEKEVTLYTLNDAVEGLRKDIAKIRMALEQKGITFKPLTKGQLKLKALEIIKRENGIDASCKSVSLEGEKATAILSAGKREFELVMDGAGELVSLNPTTVFSKTSRLAELVTGSHRRLAGFVFFAILLLFGFSFLPPFDLDRLALAFSGEAASQEYCPKLDPLLIMTATEIGSNATVPVSGEEAVSMATSNVTGFGFSHPLLVETGEGFLWLVTDVRAGGNVTANFCLINAETGRLCDCRESPELLAFLRENVPMVSSILG